MTETSVEQTYYDDAGLPYIDEKLRILKNWSYTYRGVAQVGSPKDFPTDQDFREFIHAKYKKIDSGETKPVPWNDPRQDLKKDYQDIREDIKVLGDELKAGTGGQVEVVTVEQFQALKAELAEMRDERAASNGRAKK